MEMQFTSCAVSSMEMQQPESCAPPHITQLATCKIEEGEGCPECNWVGNLLSVSVKASSCLDSNLFWANKASCDESSNRLLLVGMCALSRKIAWSLATIFSINSMASLGVFNFIFPSTEASKSCLDYGLNPSMKILSWIGSENP